MRKLSEEEAEFLRRSRLFDSKKRKYIPKKKTIEKKLKEEKSVIKEDNRIDNWIKENYDNYIIEQHEKDILRFFMYEYKWKSGMKHKLFFTCPYCEKGYDIWKFHEKRCGEYKEKKFLNKQLDKYLQR